MLTFTLVKYDDKKLVKDLETCAYKWIPIFVNEQNEIVENKYKLKKPTKKQIKSDFDKFLSSRRMFVFLIKKDDEYCGYSVFCKHDVTACGTLMEIFIDPNHRRQKIGSNFLKSVCQYLKDSYDFKKIRVAPFYNNNIGISLYKSVGFIEKQPTYREFELTL